MINFMYVKNIVYIKLITANTSFKKYFLCIIKRKRCGDGGIFQRL